MRSKFVNTLLSCCLSIPLVILGVGLTSCTRSSHTPTSTQGPAPESGQLPTRLYGLWMREWIRRPGIAVQDPNAVQNSPQLVRYLQTPSSFGDMRFPADRPDLSHAKSFNDLTDDELRILAKQQGFVGYTTLLDGSVDGPGPVSVQWHRQMDFEPPTGNLDRGRLEFMSHDQMNENALDNAYTEHWVSLTSGDGRFFVASVEHQGRLDRMLLVAGDQFFYGRNRPKDLPAAPSMDSLMTGASRAQMIDYLDFELSVGRVRGGSLPWEIQYSTIPWREKVPLDFVDSIHVDSPTNAVDVRVGEGDTWKVPTNTMDPADLKFLFPAK